MPAPLEFSAIGRLPAPGDNVAIAIRRLEAGEVILLDRAPRVLAHTILEGHRFAVRPIAPGSPLLSWGLPFGHALAPLAPGDYVCNASMLAALAVRQLGLALPAQPNFADHLVPFALDEAAFRAAPPVAPAEAAGTFLGYVRPGTRGVGTRNTVVILGTSSRTASFARQLAARLQPLARVHPGLDGIVAIAHTEGGGEHEPNNAPEVLRALAGFLVHPNVGAVLAVDQGVEPVTNARLRDFALRHGYPLADVPHRFLSLGDGRARGLAEGEAIVRGWLPTVAAAGRTPAPLAALRVALQCGGSDAFSGISGNPLAGAIVHELVRQGGTGVLTETDELVGSEPYLMQNIRDLPTARALLGHIERFQERLAWHGTTAESNPSAGNKLRGLYNITLKSLGAVHKKDPRTRLDHVRDYAEPLGAPGFYFQNGPGNDLEGIAGQVAAGCNLIIFVTGNGSITNFPFVPTLKVTTTTRRHQLLHHEMDFNAGRYLDGEPMAALAAEGFALLRATAAGQRTQGERAGHAQVSLWRDWRQTDSSRLAELQARPAPAGAPLLEQADIRAPAPAALALIPLYAAGAGHATDRLGLILPTSMCAAQIARMAAERLNAQGLAAHCGLTRFVALAHSEGCGFGGEPMYHLLQRTYRGYATHPNVAATLLLEHGCEKIPNDAVRRQFESAQLPLDRFGWASVQLDGGIARTLAGIEAWFAGRRSGPTAPARVPAPAGALAVGLLSAGAPGEAAARAFAAVAQALLAAGGSILLPEGDPLLAAPAFRAPLLGERPVQPTLAYGQPLTRPGLHVVATESDHWVENLTGLGGCGAHLFLTLVHQHARQGHPLLPVLQVAEARDRGTLPPEDLDVFLSGDDKADPATLLRLVTATAAGDLVPAASASGLVDFQLSRGLLGVST